MDPPAIGATRLFPLTVVLPTPEKPSTAVARVVSIALTPISGASEAVLENLTDASPPLPESANWTPPFLAVKENDPTWNR